MATVEATPGDAAPAIPARQFLALLALAAVVGVVVSLASWCFLQLVHYIPEWVYEDLADAVGYEHGAPLWWYLPGCAFAALVVAFAIVRLPGRGGTSRPRDSNPSPTQPIELPGVMLAAVATLGLGLVLGPEAPLLALGSGLGILAIRLLRKDAPDEVVGVMAAAGSFAALSFIFASPLIAAVILIEATGIGGPEAADGARPGPPGRGDRVAGLARDGIVHRPRHEQLRAGSAVAAGVRPAGLRRLLVDGPVRGRDRRGDVRDPAGRPRVAQPHRIA